MINPKVYPLCAMGAALLLAMAVGAAQTTPTGSAPAAVGTESVTRTVEDGGTGPYKAIMVGDSSLATHTIFRPKDLEAFGDKVKLPILAWGNGGCANSPSGHQNYLSEIASHGFLVVAIGPMPAAGGARGGGGGGGGAGGSSKSSQMLDAINWATAQNSDKASRYFGKIDVSKIGVFGHSCGGLQALEVSNDPRITTTMVVDSGILNSAGGGGGPGGGARGAGRGAGPASAPATAPTGGAMGPVMVEELFNVGMPGGAGGGAPRGGVGGGAPRGGGAGAGGGMAGMPALSKEHLTKLHAPVFYLLGGTQDMAYENGMDDFKRIEKLPAFVANRDVGHGGTFTQPHGGEWAKVSVAWFKWQLKGDADAGKLFTGDPCGLSKESGWKVDKKNIP